MVGKKWNKGPSVIRANILKFQVLRTCHSLMENTLEIERGLKMGGVGAYVDK